MLPEKVRRANRNTCQKLKIIMSKFQANKKKLNINGNFEGSRPKR